MEVGMVERGRASPVSRKSTDERRQQEREASKGMLN